MKVRVATKWASGQLVDSNDPVLVIEFHARSENASSVYVGLSDVTTQTGREIPPGESCTMNFSLPDTGRSSGSVLLSHFYAAIDGNDGLDYVAIIRGDM